MRANTSPVHASGADYRLSDDEQYVRYELRKDQPPCVVGCQVTSVGRAAILKLADQTRCSNK